MIKLVKYQDALSGLTFADLFAGIGAFRQAMESFGATCVFSSEIDEACRETYQANYGELPAGDITKIHANDIPQLDVLCGGFPCTPFTIAGSRMGFKDAKSGHLFFEIARIVEAKKPLLVLCENVPNLLSHDSGWTWTVVRGTLEKLGYDVYFKTLNAGKFGIPQARNRLYMVCERKDLGRVGFQFPRPTNENVVLGDVTLPSSETMEYAANLNGRNAVLDLRPVQRILKPVRIGKINNGSMGERIYHSNGHAITMCTNGGGIGGATGLYLVDGVVRKLAPRECARISGFPESFKLNRSTRACWHQFGNTIVVDVLQHIIQAVIEQDVLQANVALRAA